MEWYVVLMVKFILQWNFETITHKLKNFSLCFAYATLYYTMRTIFFLELCILLLYLSNMTGIKMCFNALCILSFRIQFADMSTRSIKTHSHSLVEYSIRANFDKILFPFFNRVLFTKAHSRARFLGRLICPNAIYIILGFILPLIRLTMRWHTKKNYSVWFPASKLGRGNAISSPSPKIILAVTQPKLCQ